MIARGAVLLYFDQEALVADQLEAVRLYLDAAEGIGAPAENAAADARELEEEIEERTDAALALGVLLPVSWLRRRLGLTASEERVVWVLIAHELCPEARRRLRALAAEDAGEPSLDVLRRVVYGARAELRTWRELSPDGALGRCCLIQRIDRDEDAPSHRMTFRVARRVLALVHGDLGVDEELAGIAERAADAVAMDELEVDPAARDRVREHVARGSGLAVLHGRAGAGRRSLWLAAAREAGREVLVVDARRLAGDREAAERQLRVVGARVPAAGAGAAAAARRRAGRIGGGGGSARADRGGARRVRARDGGAADRAPLAAAAGDDRAPAARGPCAGAAVAAGAAGGERGGCGAAGVGVSARAGADPRGRRGGGARGRGRRDAAAARRGRDPRRARRSARGAGGAREGDADVGRPGAARRSAEGDRRAARADPRAPPGVRGVGVRGEGGARARGVGAVLGAARDREDDVRGVDRPRARDRAVPGGSRADRVEVDRRDREAPGGAVRRGGGRARDPAVRRGRRAVRQADGGDVEQRPPREPGGRLSAAAARVGSRGSAS